MVNEKFWVKCSECPLIIIFTMQEFTKKPGGILECPAGNRCEYAANEIKRGTPPSTPAGTKPDENATLAADFLAELEEGIEILRRASPPDQERIDRLVRLTVEVREYIARRQDHLS